MQPPQWISPESWAAFVDMRRKIKAPLTDYAEKLVIAELVKLKSARQDPQACLDQSIMLGWRDVFPVRDKGLSVSPTIEAWRPPPPLTADEREASERARKAAMGAVRRVI